MALRQIHTRYSRFLSNAFKNSKTGVLRNPIQESISRTDSQPIFRNSELQKRFYFKNREYDQGKWFHNSKRVRYTLYFFTSGALIAVSSGKWVTVPCTGRTHFVLFYEYLEEFLPDERCGLAGEPLPPLHSDSITAQRIYQDIIRQALPVEMVISRSLEKDGRKQDECEITVVNSPVVLATSCGRFGKIYITKALLQFYREQEAMIATIFAREVGHGLARHYEETISKTISLASVTGTSLYLFCQSSYIRSKMPFLVKFTRRRFLPSFSLVAIMGILSFLQLKKISHKMDVEADHIGLMLAASAGYNPEIGLLFPVYRHNEIGAYPSGEERSLYLTQPEVLDEAISRFRQATKPPNGTDSS